jgi:hypothetical protein
MRRLLTAFALFLCAMGNLLAAESATEPAPAPASESLPLQATLRLLAWGGGVPPMSIVSDGRETPVIVPQGAISPPILYRGPSPIVFYARPAAVAHAGAAAKTAERFPLVEIRPHESSRNLLVIFFPREPAGSKPGVFSADFSLPSESTGAVRVFNLLGGSTAVLVQERQITVAAQDSAAVDVQMRQAGAVRLGVGVQTPQTGEWTRLIDRPVLVTPGQALLILLVPDPQGANGVALRMITDTQALATPVNLTVERNSAGTR